MYYVGITGGVGSGKSRVLAWLEEHTDCRVIRSDDLARSMTEKGQPCWQAYVDLFGSEVLDKNGEVDRKKVSSLVFGNEKLLEQLNQATHPLVSREIARLAEETDRAGRAFFFLESAVLIEEKYDEICDELWYVYADENVRRQRLRSERGYSEERITKMMESQLPEEVYREKCRFVIDNSGDFSETASQLSRWMEENIHVFMQPGERKQR